MITNLSHDIRTPLTGNPEAIRRVLQNIVGNALEHGQKQIVFMTKSEDEQAIFRCMNDVESPDGIDMTQVFSRFYKADSARRNTSKRAGAGEFFKPTPPIPPRRADTRQRMTPRL